MPADVSIRIRAESDPARRELSVLQSKMQCLNTQFGNTERAAHQASGLVDQFGRPLGEASDAAQRFNVSIS